MSIDYSSMDDKLSSCTNKDTIIEIDNRWYWLDEAGKQHGPLRSNTMGMHLSSSLSMSINQFTNICKSLGLPVPEVDEEAYCAIVTKELFDIYEEEAKIILKEIELGELIDMNDYSFLICWNILYQAHIEWLGKYNTQQDPKEWGDLYFG